MTESAQVPLCLQVAGGATYRCSVVRCIENVKNWSHIVVHPGVHVNASAATS
jgi:hypothetical protein